ncbi:hypothetical protein [Vibrio diazotrophicus]
MPMKYLLIVLFWSAISFAIHYVMASHGEPRSLWLMQTLGVM